MDIAALSMAMSQQKIMTDIGVGVLDMSMDTAETIGSSMIQMMEQSVTPNLGQSIDIKL